MGKKYVPIKGTARNIYGQEVAMDITINMDYFDQIASDNGYVKLEPGQVVVDGEALKKAFADSDIEFYVEVEDGLTFDAVIESVVETIKEARDE